MESYIRLIYTSNMTKLSNNHLVINKIIYKSYSNNLKSFINGKLIWTQSDSSIIQILEGRSEKIHALFEYIKTDNRHYNITVLSINDIMRSDIIFDKWVSNITHSPSIPFENSIQNYKLLCIIGSGGTSTVVLGENHFTKKRYALKMINKRRMKDKNILRITTERDILSSANHPFVQNLKSSIQDACHIYFVTNFASRGDLFTCVKNVKFTVEISLFYICEVISGLRYLHAQNIIHNDIKLENVLINADGHIALTDFGVSFISDEGVIPRVDPNDMDGSNKGGVGFGVRVVGTPFYFAPEVINQMLKTKASDIWAVGIMLCEMMTVTLPWQGKSKKEMYEIICESEMEKIVDSDDSVIISLVSVLCDHNHKTRFTCENIISLIIDIGSVKNWDDVENKTIIPPYIPDETHPVSTTIHDFERHRESTPDNDNNFYKYIHEKYNIEDEDFNPNKMIFGNN